MGSRPTNRELEETLRSATDRIATLQSKFNVLLDKNKQQERAIEYYQRMLSYYQNPNTPPSADSLEWKRQKRERAQQRKDGEGNDNNNGKPGGRTGHAGVSRHHSPQRRQRHDFERRQSGRSTKRILPRCRCGKAMVLGDPRVRDIIEMEVTAHETRHRIETAVCTSCGHTEEAPNGDLPRLGSYGKKMAGFVSELRAARVPLKVIPRIIHSVARVSMSASTANSIMARTADALEGQASEIAKNVAKSESAGFDETMHRDCGTKKQTNVAQSGKNISIQISPSRATLMLDSMDYDGIAVTDAYRGYDRFNAEDRHQLCWSHDIRKAKTLAEKYDPLLDDGRRKKRRQYLEDLRFVFKEAKHVARLGAHSRRQRHVMEDTLADVLDRYCGTDDADLHKLVMMMYRHLPHLFTFVQYAGVEPTNNASERALRYMVVFRKISGQTKGGSKSMKRLGDFVSCVLTWQNHGKSVAQEVARLI